MPPCWRRRASFPDRCWNVLWSARRSPLSARRPPRLAQARGDPDRAPHGGSPHAVCSCVAFADVIGDEASRLIAERLPPRVLGRRVGLRLLSVEQRRLSTKSGYLWTVAPPFRTERREGPRARSENRHPGLIAAQIRDVNWATTTSAWASRRCSEQEHCLLLAMARRVRGRRSSQPSACSAVADLKASMGWRSSRDGSLFVDVAFPRPRPKSDAASHVWTG